MIERIDERTHSLDDRMLRAKLIAYLEEEAAGAGWVAFVMRANGTMIERESPPMPSIERPDAEKRDFARRLCRRLNKEMPYMGAWVVAWCGDKKWIMLWKDADGDRQFVIYNDEPWVRTRQVAMEKWLADADAGWRKTFLIRSEIVGIRPDQTYRDALGEVPPRMGRAH